MSMAAAIAAMVPVSLPVAGSVPVVEGVAVFVGCGVEGALGPFEPFVGGELTGGISAVTVEGVGDSVEGGVAVGSVELDVVGAGGVVVAVDDDGVVVVGWGDVDDDGGASVVVVSWTVVGVVVVGGGQTSGPQMSHGAGPVQAWAFPAGGTSSATRAARVAARATRIRRVRGMGFPLGLGLLGISRRRRRASRAR